MFTMWVEKLLWEPEGAQKTGETGQKEETGGAAGRVSETENAAGLARVLDATRRGSLGGFSAHGSRGGWR